MFWWRRRISSAVIHGMNFFLRERKVNFPGTKDVLPGILFGDIYIFFEAVDYKKSPTDLIKMKSLVNFRLYIYITQFGVIEIFYTAKWCCSQDWI